MSTPKFASRAAATTLMLVCCWAACFAQLMAPADRGKAMESIRTKYKSLTGLDHEARANQTVAFAKTITSIEHAEVTEDRNIACIFKDGVPFMLLASIPAVPPEKVIDLRTYFRPGTMPAPAPTTISPFEPRTTPAATTQAQKPNDMPESLDARLVNALGPNAFGDSCAKVRELLTSKGYRVAAGTDGTIETLMNIRSQNLGVFYMQCHGGNTWVRNPARLTNPNAPYWIQEYTLVSSERWTAPRETAISELTLPGAGADLLSGGYVGICWALEEVNPGTNIDWNYPFFTITRKFIRTFWKFGKNSFVMIYGCTTNRLSDVMEEPSVNASVYCGTNHLGASPCHKWIQMSFDRMLGANDPQVLPEEDFCPQRPFDWKSLYTDMKDRKNLFPISATDGKGRDWTVSPVFNHNRDNFGLLAPSIKHLSPVAYQLKLDLVGTFGADPGDGNRKVS
jgi:hypothetical protein